jgi:hypothetical protein
MRTTSIGKPEIIASPKPMFRAGFDREKSKLINERLYWQSVIGDAQRKVFPIGAIIAGATGVKLGSVLNLGTVDKLLLGLLGGLIGKEFDDERSKKKFDSMDSVIENAKEQIKRVDLALMMLEQAEIHLKDMKEQGQIKQKNNGIAKFIAADDYVKRQVNTIGFKGKWKYLLGDPDAGFLALITGMPGSGKSTFAIEFADYLQKHHGSTLYVASEQPNINLPLQSLLKRVEATFTVNTAPSANSLSKDVKGYKFAVIDSINHLGIDAMQLEEVRKENPSLSIVAIMQSTKDGNFKGSQEFLHNADIRVELDKLTAKQTKSRYAPPAEIPARAGNAI